MTSPSRSLSITSWIRPPSEKSPSMSTGSGCTRCATPASSTTTWWGNTRRWSRTPATCCSWPGWRTKLVSLPRPRAPGLQETWLPSSSTTSALFIRRSYTISIAWTSCFSTTLCQPTSSLDEAGFHSPTESKLQSPDTSRRSFSRQTLQELFKQKEEQSVSELQRK